MDSATVGAGMLVSAIVALGGVITYLFKMIEKDFEGLKTVIREKEALIKDKDDVIEQLYNKLVEVHCRRPDILSSSELPQMPVPSSKG